ncbi:MAG: glycogen synthase [Elusimicrobiota bacterium]
MKVTMMAKEYPPYIYGGAGVHLRYLSQELSKIMDVEVRCFGDQKADDKIKVRGYNGWEALKGKKFSPALETLSVNMLAQVEEIDSDIVHAHTWYGHFGGYLAKILYNIPLVVTCHSLEPLRPWKQEQLGRGYRLSTLIEKIGIESADKVIAVSNLMRQDILKFFNVPFNKIEVIHNGVDLNKWKHTPLSDSLKKKYKIADDYVLFVGRPTPQKGLEYLVESADEIPVQIVLGATGADTKDYEDRMTKGVEKKKNIVWIHELLKEEEYVQLYSSAKIFICPSIYEPFGIINLEAMACKTPVVASSTGGITEVVISEKTGLLIEPRNSKQIVDAVNRLLKDENLRKSMGEEGRKRVEEFFSWTHIAEKTKKLYENLI